MASESSSALLELTDADTDATTVTDDTHEGAPVIMERGYDIAIKVDAPMKQLSTLETFVTYRVRCVCARWPTPPHVRRRFNHFKLLHKRLVQAHPLIAPPPLPPLHSARQQLDRYSPAFVAVRTLALNAFLDRVAKHPILTHSVDFRVFVTTPDEELDKVFRNESSALNLWGLSSALYGSGESKNANGPRVKHPEFTSAADYLQSLQQKLTTLCALTTKLHKGTATLSTEFMGMKRACDAWATQAGGRVARCAGALAGGSRAASAAAAGSLRARAYHQALLPLLAAYAAAHRDKITQRDAMHAAYVSGTNATDELHNRLEQASEALRSELSDWTPKTRADIKALLLDLADRQLTLHNQTLQGWESALKLSSETSIDEIFKTVSKTAVQNLSPSKCRSELTPTETERDLDDFSEDFDIHSGNDEFCDVLNDASKVNGGKNEDFVVKNEGDRDKNDDNNDDYRDICSSNDIVGGNKTLDESNINYCCTDDINTVSGKIDVTNNFEAKDVSAMNSVEKDSSNVLNFSCTKSNTDGEASEIVDNSQVHAINNQISNEKPHDLVNIDGADDVLNEILEDTAAAASTSASSQRDDGLKEVMSDPLRDFSDVDLS